MKKVSLVFGGLLTVFLLPVTLFVSSCSSQAWKTNIQFVVSPQSTLADHSFNENVYNGVQDFFRQNVYGQDWSGPNASSLTDNSSGVWRSSRANTIPDFFEAYHSSYNSGARLLICNGFEQNQPLQGLNSDEVLSKQADWAKILRNNLGFIYVDGQLSSSYSDGSTQFNSNPYDVASIAYKIDDAAFWGGVLTGIELNQNSKYIPINNDGTYGGYKGPTYLVGGFVGWAIPPTLAFLNGWCQGLNYFNAQLDTFNKDKKTDAEKYKPVAFISSTGKYNNMSDDFASGSFSPSESKVTTIVDNYINKGVSAILPVAGPQTSIVVKQIVQNKKPIMVVGVDTSVEVDSSVNMWTNGAPVIPFSITKNLSKSVEDVLTSINDKLLGKQISTSYEGFGYNNFATWTNQGVGLSYKSFKGNNIVDTDYKAIINTYLGKQTSAALPIPADLQQEITGKEFQKERTAQVGGQKIITVPAVTGGLNSYDSGSGKPQPIVADKSDPQKIDAEFAKQIATFITTLTSELVVDKDGNKQVGWYMTRN